MRHSIRAYLLLFLFMFLLLVPAYAQDTPHVPDALSADVETVDGIMAAVYDVISGGQGVERDWDRFRSLFHPSAHLIPSGFRQDGSSFILYWDVETYISSAGANLVASGFFEKEIHRVEERFGGVAHIFSTYESRRTAKDEEPFTRGINSFQLKYDGDRWWVVNIFWQGENPNTPIPAKYGG